ncbi:MAG: S-layer homology domain-containing protein, partial [Oscillospiraceae bacterium]|nr:S-layer homology domain-containing protein [Oscillospiraceae bacterium]
MKKKILAMLLSVALLAGAIPVTASAASVEQFSDVKARDWFYDAVEYAVSNGLFHGTGETTFSPEQSMTRGMFVTVLGRKSNV